MIVRKSPAGGRCDHRSMDDRKVGTLFRLLRQRRRWRQIDVAARAGVSQQLVSELELGQLDRVGLRAARRVAATLDARLDLALTWRGPETARLLDAAHASLVEVIVAQLRANDWTPVVEWSFSHFGERGAVDVVGWRPDARALFIVEVKSRLVDLQDLVSSMDRKTRLAPRLLRDERGWICTSVGRALVLPAGSTAYETVERHRAIFDVTFPARSREVRRWLRSPEGSLSGILFLRSTTGSGAPIGGRRPQRVRTPRSRSDKG
jgi:transcriptional regulator with XRE-family HTH domain